MLVVASKPDGIAVAVNILSMRLRSELRDNRKAAPEIAEAGRAILGEYRFHRQDGPAVRHDYELGEVIKVSLGDDVGKPIARKLCRELVDAVVRYQVSAHDHDDVMSALFQVHPVEVLDELFAGTHESRANGIRIMNTLFQFRKHPLAAVSDEVIIGWCDGEPASRYPLAAAVALLFIRAHDKAPHEWTSLTGQLLLKAPDPDAVFKEIVSRLTPMSWSGSLAAKLESRLTLLKQLDLSAFPALAGPLDAAKATLERRIETERRSEAKEARARGGRFEWP